MVGKHKAAHPELSAQEYHYVDDLSPDQLKELENRPIAGCDPGKRNMVCMIDKHGNQLQYRAAQRRSENKGKRNMHILQKEKKINAIQDKEKLLLEHNSKTMNYGKFKAYLKAKNTLNQQTMEFYRRDLWRKMKFRSYSYGQKSMDKFLNKIGKTFGNTY